ncbi:hypothetical protein R1sor_020517 [Riccia sorocarpa]|uniref:Uncharacterized protein n=1 Tax=Riccia sorocarpa TaxID=122646 RepID=A0ABD3IFH0_9MARC
MTLSSSSNSSSRISGTQSTPTLNNNRSMDELHSRSSLQQLREKNLKLAELLLDSLRRNLEENRRAQTEQKELIDAVQNSTELDALAKESILRHLKTLKDQRMRQPDYELTTCAASNVAHAARAG